MFENYDFKQRCHRSFILINSILAVKINKEACGLSL